MSRVLVAGGTGFVGTPTVAALPATSHDVRVFDLRPREGALPPALTQHVEIVAGDVTDTAALAGAAEGCDGTVHLAGLMTVDCARDPLPERSASIRRRLSRRGAPGPHVSFGCVPACRPAAGRDA